MALNLKTLTKTLTLDPIDVMGESLTIEYRKPTPAQIDAMRSGFRDSGESLEKQTAAIILNLAVAWDVLDADGNALSVTPETLALIPWEAQDKIASSLYAACGLKTEADDQKND